MLGHSAFAAERCRKAFSCVGQENATAAPPEQRVAQRSFGIGAT
jgi:hypothetical protein